MDHTTQLLSIRVQPQNGAADESRGLEPLTDGAAGYSLGWLNQQAPPDNTRIFVLLHVTRSLPDGSLGDRPITPTTQ